MIQEDTEKKISLMRRYFSLEGEISLFHEICDFLSELADQINEETPLACFLEAIDTFMLVKEDELRTEGKLLKEEIESL